MAYQFFAKAHQQSNSSSTFSASNAKKHAHPLYPKAPPPIPTPPSISINSRLKTKEPTFEPPAYPVQILPGYKTPHQDVTIDPVSTAHIPSLTRITGLLLPIRYPNSFYTDTVTNPVIASLSRVAVYHESPLTGASRPTASPDPKTSTTKVIGGIRCRLEKAEHAHAPPERQEQGQERKEEHGNDKDKDKTQDETNDKPPTNLYIQTLHLLSPYRGNGIASSLLSSILYVLPSTSTSTRTRKLSPLVKHYNIRTVTAHVHEANEEALDWYKARGFSVDDGVVENYYRRLRPSGARIVSLLLPWEDEESDGVAGGEENGEGDADDEDGDWEKVEAEDCDELEEKCGIKALGGDDSRGSSQDGQSRKRKADEEIRRC